MKTILISGNDTNIGKTWICKALASYLASYKQNIQVVKVVETGITAGQKGDAETAVEDLIIFNEIQYQALTLYSFPDPFAPVTAARKAGSHFGIEDIIAKIKNLPETNWRILETAGGLAVPLDETGLDTVDLALQLPVDYLILVVQNRLGAIHQARVLAAYASRLKIPTGIWFNDSSPVDENITHSNFSELANLSLPIWGHQTWQAQQLNIFDSFPLANYFSTHCEPVTTHNTMQQKIHAYLHARKEAGLLRELTPQSIDNNSTNLYLNFNDYLQLSKHPFVIQTAQDALEKWGTSSAGSPAVSSYWPIHHELENVLKEWCEFEHGLLWNAGYTANKALLSTLPQNGDVVLADRYVHNSVLSGIKETSAKLIRYSHLDLNQLEDLLRTYSRPDRTVFVVTESVFSMEGDYPDLKKMSFLKDLYHFFWIVDEAHALGWYGCRGNGLVAESGVQKNVDVLVATLGKTLASQGAFTLFHDASLRSYLLNRTPEFWYSTYLSPAAVAASLAAIKIIQTEYVMNQPQWRIETLNLKTRLRCFFPELPLYDSPILPLIIGDPQTTLSMGARLAKQHRIHVGTIRPPCSISPSST